MNIKPTNEETSLMQTVQNLLKQGKFYKGGIGTTLDNAYELPQFSLDFAINYSITKTDYDISKLDDNYNYVMFAGIFFKSKKSNTTS